MKKVILQLKGDYLVGEAERLECEIKKSLDKNGFAVVDHRVDIYVIDDEESNNN